MSVNLADGKKANLREIGNLDCSGYTNRRKRRIACGDFFKGTVYSFCCSLFLPGERFTDLPDEEIVCEAEISEWKPPEKGLLFDGR